MWRGKSSSHAHWKRGKLPAALAVLLVMSPAAYASAYSIKGQVLSPDNSPISTSVTILDTATRQTVKTVNSDTNGFLIADLPSGRYSIAASNSDYLTVNEEMVNVNDADVVFENVYTEAATVTLNVTIWDAAAHPAPGVQVNLRDTTTGALVFAQPVTSDVNGVASFVSVSYKDLQNNKYEIDVIDGANQYVGIGAATPNAYGSYSYFPQTRTVSKGLQLIAPIIP